MLEEQVSSKVVLGSDDLELLQKFLEAWCEENGVDPQSDRAQSIASGLFNWYQFQLGDRVNLKPEPSEPLPESMKLNGLLRQLEKA
jgi:hypothetical protein